MKGLLYILVFVFALDAQAGILFRRRSGGIFSGARRSGGVFRRRVGCIPGQCAQSGFYRNQGSRPVPRNSLPQSIEGGSDFGNSTGGHDLGGAQPQPSFAQPGVSQRPEAEPPRSVDPLPAIEPERASSTVRGADDDLAVPAPALQLSGTKGLLAAGTPAPVKATKINENDALKKYFEQKKAETNKKAEEWKTKILAALDKDVGSVRKVIEELLIEDQMFLEPEEEEAAFGKRLKELSAEERKSLVREYTQLQKELREKLLTEVAAAVRKSDSPKAKLLSESIADIKKDHLEAYDRVIKEVDKGTIDTDTTYCFTCGAGEPIGNEGYTFGGAMEEAAARVAARLSEVRVEAPKPPVQPQATGEKPSSNSGSAASRTLAAPAQPISPPASKPPVSQAEKVARERIDSPVIEGPRAAGNGKRAFEQYMNILNGDPSLSDSTLRRFLNSGYYAQNNPQYRARIDGLSRDELLGAVAKFLDGAGPYNHCPSCNLGAGGRLSR